MQTRTVESALRISRKRDSLTGSIEGRAARWLRGGRPMARTDLENERAWLLEIVGRVGYPQVKVGRCLVSETYAAWHAFLIGASQSECDRTWDALFACADRPWMTCCNGRVQLVTR